MQQNEVKDKPVRKLFYGDIFSRNNKLCMYLTDGEYKGLESNTGRLMVGEIFMSPLGESYFYLGGGKYVPYENVQPVSSTKACKCEPSISLLTERLEKIESWINGVNCSWRNDDDK